MAHISYGSKGSVACSACVLDPGTRRCSSLLGRFGSLSMLMVDDRELHAVGVTATLSISSVRSVASYLCCLFPVNAKFSCANTFFQKMRRSSVRSFLCGPPNPREPDMQSRAAQNQVLAKAKRTHPTNNHLITQVVARADSGWATLRMRGHGGQTGAVCKGAGAMLVTESGTVMFFRRVQRSNARLPMVVTE